MGMPEVSVVMGVYNGGKDLYESVNSILSQQGVDFEFIIVNDGSTDGSAEKLDAFAAEDARVKIIHQENAGLTRALIRGCSESRGEFIARQDADDVSLPGRLAAQLDVLKHNPDIVLVSSWSECEGPNGEDLFTHKPADDVGESTRKLLNGNEGPSAHGSAMFRKCAYAQAGGYREEFYCAQDNDLWLRIGHLGRYCVIQEVLYRYKVCPRSISGSKRGLAGQYDRLAHACHRVRLAGQDESQLLKEAANLRDSKQLQQRETSSLAMTYFIGRCLLARRDHRAAGYFRLIISNAPWNLRAWASYMQSLLLSRNS